MSKMALFHVEQEPNFSILVQHVKNGILLYSNRKLQHFQVKILILVNDYIIVLKF